MKGRQQQPAKQGEQLSPSIYLVCWLGNEKQKKISLSTNTLRDSLSDGRTTQIPFTSIHNNLRMKRKQISF